MTGKNKFILTLIVFVIIFIVSQILFFYSRDQSDRKISSLFNRYYHIVAKNPIAAKTALDLILRSYPKNQQALRERGYWYLRQGDTYNALNAFTKANQNNANDPYTAIELAKLYIMVGKTRTASELLDQVLNKTYKDQSILTQAIALKKQISPNYISLIDEKLVFQNLPQLKSAWLILTDVNFKLNKIGTVLAFIENYKNFSPIGDLNTVKNIRIQPLSAESTQKRADFLNTFYKEKTVNPERAMTIIKLMLSQYPNDILGLKEAGYLSLSLKAYPQAFYYLNRAYQITLDPHLALQLAFILDKIGNKQAAVNYFRAAAKTNNQTDKDAALRAIHYYTKLFAVQYAQGQASALSRHDILINEFYQNKKTQPKLAWKALKELLGEYPNDITALREAGYFALNEKDNIAAFYYLNRAYQLSHDNGLALQIGYILDALNQKHLALEYFLAATCAKKIKDRYRAQIAYTNLSLYQAKFLPDPIYLDFFADPFHFSRFGLFIETYVAHLGIELNKALQWKFYLSYRLNRDNRTNFINGIPIIYDDNVLIYSVGTQITPFSKLPVTVFIEGGRAKDLIYRDRGRWRGDFRGGLALYKDWGNETRYTFEPTLEAKFLGDIYSDAIYFSRYRDAIFTLRLRPGFEFYRYRTTSMSIYLRGFLIEDTQRDFFNNLFEYGLGLRFIPNDRLNLALRYEINHGHYLPAGGSFNPYSPNYINHVWGADFFIRF